MAQADQRISEYVLEVKLGGGAFGEVWRAHHHVWADQLVAIKIPTDPDYVRNLQREGAAIHGLVHPNIVRAIGFDPYASPPYLAMEYVPGTSLRPLIAQRQLKVPDAVAVMRQILGALGYAHSQGLIHRDVKPENILVHERALKDGFATPGVVKVADFGLGKAKKGMEATSIAYSQSISSAGDREIAGTLDYMAPEQRGGADPDGRGDLYACGVILYEMLTGERPAGTDLPSALNPSVPKYLDEVFRRSYARLDKRYASAEEFQKALAEPTGWATPSTSPTACPQCHQPVAMGDQFCIRCGVQLVGMVRRCQQCGAYPDPTDVYCIFCGNNLAPESAAVA
jgi:serine/threonine protein kinase